MALGRSTRVSLLIGTGHFLSHFYQLCLPPLFLVWQRAFGVSFAEVGVSVAVMAAVTAVLQTPVGSGSIATARGASWWAAPH